MKKIFTTILLTLVMISTFIMCLPSEEVEAASFSKKRVGYYYQVDGEYQIDVTYITKKHIYYSLYSNEMGMQYIYKYYPVKIKNANKAYDKDSKMTFTWSSNTEFRISCPGVNAMEGTYVAAPAAPTVSNWKEVPMDNSEGDGVEYRIRWNDVDNADGYQVKLYEKESAYDEDWYVWKQMTKKCSASIQFSSLYQFKAKVRAYKMVNGKRIYGNWSEVRKKIMFW